MNHGVFSLVLLLVQKDTPFFLLIHTPEIVITPLRQADLQGADLTGANLGYVSLEGGNLREALLINAKLAGAKLEEASFVDADLAGAHLSYYWKGSCSDFGWEARVATVNNTDFTNANLSGANLLGLMKDISSGIEGAELSNANLDAVQIGSGPEGSNL